MNKPQSLGGGLGPGFCVLQMSSHTKAQEDKADPSDPASQCPLHPMETERVGSFWVACPTSSPHGWSQMTLSWSLTSLEGMILISWVYVLQPKGGKAPCKGEAGNSQPGHLGQGLANVLMHQAAPGTSCCCGAGGIGRREALRSSEDSASLFLPLSVSSSVGVMIEEGRGGWESESSVGRAASPADVN